MRLESAWGYNIFEVIFNVNVQHKVLGTISCVLGWRQGCPPLGGGEGGGIWGRPFGLRGLNEHSNGSLHPFTKPRPHLADRLAICPIDHFQNRIHQGNLELKHTLIQNTIDVYWGGAIRPKLDVKRAIR